MKARGLPIPEMYQPPVPASSETAQPVAAATASSASMIGLH